MQKNEKIGLLKKRAQGCGKLFSKIKIVYITLVASVIICKKRILKKFTLFFWKFCIILVKNKSMW